MLLIVGGTLAVLFVPFPWWIPIVAALAAIELIELRLWLWAIRARPRAGTEGMVGERGTLSAKHRVRIRGTSYPATAMDAEPGDRVVVERVDGMTLVVRRAPDES